VAERAQTFNGQPSLLSGATFEACLEQYKALLGHVERMWADACEFYTRGNYPFAAFFSILVIEEIGKLSRLAEDLMHYDLPRAAAQSGTVERSHRRKHFIGVVSGALINAWLERVLGKDVIRKILHQAESDELEKIRQSCLYERPGLENSSIMAPHAAPCPRSR
jgi:AbiV family abortive infection protein